MTFDGAAIPLTRREVEVLRYLWAAKGKVVSTEALLRDVWDYHPRSRTRAVSMLMGRLRKKIEPNPAQPVYLRNVYGAGYLLSCDAPGEDAVAEARQLVQASRGEAFGSVVSTLSERFDEWTRALAYVTDPDGRAWLQLARAAASVDHAHDVPAGELWEAARTARDPKLADRAAAAAVELVQATGALVTALGAAQEWLSTHPESSTPGVYEVRLKLLFLTVRMGRFERATELGTALLAAAERSGDRRVQGLVLDRFATIARRSGEAERAYHLGMEALEQLALSNCELARLSVAHNIGVSMYTSGNLADASRLLGEAAVGFSRARADRNAVHAHLNLAAVCLASNDPQTAGEMLEHAATTSDRRALGRWHLLRARLAILEEDPVAVGEHAGRAHYLAGRIGAPRLIAQTARHLGWHAALIGDVAQARRLFLQAWSWYAHEGRDDLGAGAMLHWWGEACGDPPAEGEARWLRGGARTPWLSSGPVPHGPWWVDVVATRALREQRGHR